MRRMASMVETAAKWVHHTRMRHILPILGVLVLVLGIVLAFRGRKSPDLDDGSSGNGVLIVVATLGACVAIAAFWFFLTWAEFAS